MLFPSMHRWNRAGCCKAALLAGDSSWAVPQALYLFLFGENCREISAWHSFVRVIAASFCRGWKCFHLTPYFFSYKSNCVSFKFWFKYYRNFEGENFPWCSSQRLYDSLIWSLPDFSSYMEYITYFREKEITEYRLFCNEPLFPCQLQRPIHLQRLASVYWVDVDSTSHHLQGRGWVSFCHVVSAFAPDAYVPLGSSLWAWDQ